jgi:hypothetical protein
MLFFCSSIERRLTRGNDEGVYFGGCNHQSPGGLRACENGLIRYLDLLGGRAVTITIEVEIDDDGDKRNGGDSAKNAPYDSSDRGRMMSCGGG